MLTIGKLEKEKSDLSEQLQIAICERDVMSIRSGLRLARIRKIPAAPHHHLLLLSCTHTYETREQAMRLVTCAGSGNKRGRVWLASKSLVS
jgi:hypothetical protein